MADEMDLLRTQSTASPDPGLTPSHKPFGEDEWPAFQADVQKQLDAATTQGERGWIMENARLRWANKHPYPGHWEGHHLAEGPGYAEDQPHGWPGLQSQMDQLNKTEKLYDFTMRQIYPNNPSIESPYAEKLPAPSRGAPPPTIHEPTIHEPTIIDRTLQWFRNELDRENHGMPHYQSGGDPPVGQPALVGEQGTVQLTPVEHDPFDELLPSRAAHTIMALGRSVTLTPVDHDPFN